MRDSANHPGSSDAAAVISDGELACALAALLIEDSSADAELVVSALEDSGFLPLRWRRVADAAAMETALAEEHWDVVLCDPRPRALHPSKALAVLRASGLDAPLILVSGAIGEKTIAAIRAGAADLVSRDRPGRLGVAVGGSIGELNERRSAERAGHDSKQRFETSVETLIDPLVLLRPVRDESGRVVDFVYEYANDAACASSDLAREALVGTRLREGSTQLIPAGRFDAYVRVIETGDPLVLDDCPNDDSLTGDSDERVLDLRASKAAELLALTWRDVTERHRVEAERSRLAAIVRSSEDAIVSIDADLRIASWNNGAETIYGYSAAEILGKPSDVLIPIDATLESRGLREQTVAGAEVSRYETLRLRKDGTLIDVAITAFPLIDTAGNAYGAASIDRDITERKRAERALAESEERYREILDRTPDGVWRVDAENRTDYVNPRMASMLGYLPEEMLGRELSDFMESGWLTGAQELMANTRHDGEPAVVEQCFVRKDSTPCWVRVSHTELTDLHGTHTGALAIMSDITTSKAQEVELRASEDFLAALTNSMAEGMFALSSDGSVTYMNQAAERLLGWTEDELANRSMHDTTHHQHDDGSPYTAEDCPLLAAFHPGATVRIEDDTFTRRDGRLLPVAYSAAPITSNGDVHDIVVVFSDVSARRADEHRRKEELETLNWVGRIRDALDEDRLVLHAQPVIDLHSRKVVTHELLLRMVARDGEIVAPRRFLPAAEQFGLIDEIDGWVLAEAVHLAAVGLKVQVNISGKSLGSRALINTLVRALHNTGADPALLVCEITETALAKDEAVAAAFVYELAQLGCEIALDDFGMGYGGFGYLKRLPVAALKIDIEFVRDLPQNSENQHVVKATVNLAKGFGRRTIAEGVEDLTTLALLEELGVDYAQGFAIGRPRPIDTLIAGKLDPSASWLALERSR
jgi:PAS domain S-box-containing protein